MGKSQEIERGIITTYKNKIYKPFRKAICDYELIKDRDKIAVCISGGKDSMLMAKCLQEFQKHGDTDFELKFITMDPGYNEKSRKSIEENADRLNIPIEFFKTNIFNIVDNSKGSSPCFLCAKMRRGALYGQAEKLGCNKIALGHHFDDAIETMLINIFFGGEIKTMLPKIHSDNFNLELIRPMYLVKENDIISWKNSNNLHFINCACKFTQKVQSSEKTSKRQEIKKLIDEFRKNSKYVDLSIFHSMSNVNLDAMIGWKKSDKVNSFLDEY